MGDVVEAMVLSYKQGEYWDGDVYLPAVTIEMRHDGGKGGDFTHVVDTFKQFLVACGWHQSTVDKLVFNEESE